jgi:hypothetical protein
MEKITDKLAALPPNANYFSLEFFPPKTQAVRLGNRYTGSVADDRRALRISKLVLHGCHRLFVLYL